MTALLNIEETFAATALKSWEIWIGRTSQIFASLSDEEMFKEIAPGKNRPVYILGHLIAVNDSLIPQLRLGEANYGHLRKPFVESPDRAVAELPPLAELRQNWTDLNARLDGLFKQLSPAEWLERHATVSEEDFAKEPHRNRLAVLLSRTSHTSYHLGQLMLLVGKGTV
jgi:DinB family protein